MAQKVALQWSLSIKKTLDDFVLILINLKV